MKQEGERSDENVSLHALVGLMIDRPHVDDVLEVGEGTLDFGKFFVEAYRVDCGQIGLFGLNNVFALVSLLAREVDGMLEEAKHAVVVGPVIIAVAMISGEHAGRSSADFLGRLEPAIDDAPLQLFEPCAHAIHGLDALGALIGQALFGVHHEHPHAWFLCDNLLNQRLGRCRLLAGRDADRTFDPGAGRALDIVEHLTTAAAIAANNVAMTIAAQVFEVLARHHAAVADKDDAFEPEALLKIAQNIRDRFGIAPIALEHMMSDRPAVDQNQTNQHLRVARLAIAAVAMGAHLDRPSALKIGRGQIVEHHVDLKRKQVAQPHKQRGLDLRLAREQLVERAIPLLQLSRRHAHARRPAGLASSSRHAAMKRRPQRSQTKSLSSHCASACSLAGAVSRLATSTRARSLSRTISRRSGRASWSSVVSRPRSLHIRRAASSGPQSHAPTAPISLCATRSSPAASPCSSWRSLPRSRCSASTSLRPRLMTVRCRVLPSRSR